MIVGSEKKDVSMLSHSMSDTGEHIKNIVTGCVEKWQLAGKLHLVLRDNGCIFVLGLRDAEVPYVGRLAHTLQLIVKKGLGTEGSGKPVVLLSQDCRTL